MSPPLPPPDSPGDKVVAVTEFFTLSHHTLPAPTAGEPRAPDAADAFAHDRYENLGEIGHGGMGLVFLARDRVLDREVVVKVIRPDARAAVAVARFRTETRITSQLQHPGVPPVHDSGTLPDGSPFIVMKYVRGKTLAELLLARENPERDLYGFLDVFLQVCNAVAYAHSRGIIHRDLKPSNVMVGAFGEVQVMDWGVAKLLADGEAPGDPAAGDDAGAAEYATRAGAVVGTPAYMPPEQANGELHRVDRRADVFALGAILCELLTGLPPDRGTTSGGSPVAREVSSSSVRGFASWVLRRGRAGGSGNAVHRLTASGAPQELIDVAMRCLDPDPAARPADAGELVAALRAWEQDTQFREREAAVSLSLSLSRRLHASRLRRSLLGSASSGLFLAAALAGVAAFAVGLYALFLDGSPDAARDRLVWLLAGAAACATTGFAFRRFTSEPNRRDSHAPRP